jgi:hypothetical protein
VVTISAMIRRLGVLLGVVTVFAQRSAAQDTSRVIPKELGDVQWIVNIPEFHDSQRFRDSLRYSGPYVRAFALPGLDKLSLASFNNWVLVGLVLVDTWTDPVTAMYAVGGANALGVIGNARVVPPWSQYSNLGLTNVWNCVFLRHDAAASATTGWSAIIGNASFTNQRRERLCIPADGRPVGRNLSVIAEAPSSAAWEIPGVARILALGSNAYGLGLRCARAWCNIMPKGSSTLPAAAHAGITSLTANAQGTIRGWYDDQELVSPVDRYGRSSALAPAFRASLIPDDKLMTTTLAAFRTSLVHVATVFIPAQPNPIPPHYAKWGFELGKNEIYIQMRDAVFGTGYLKTPSGRRIALRVHRHGHKEDLPPGATMWETARWVYLDDDDAVWVGCDIGCCYIDPEM